MRAPSASERAAERSTATSGPKPAFVRKIAHGTRFAGDLTTQGIERVYPARGDEIGEDFVAIGKMHECAPGFVFEVAVAELEQARISRTLFPAHGLEPPQSALRRRHVAIVGGEQQRRTGTAHGVKFAQRGATIFATRNLHQSIEKKERATEGAGHRWRILS